MNLGERMKKYEYVNRHYLMPRTPVIVRVDGRAFHTLTRGFQKPFDGGFIGAMCDAAVDLFRDIQGCKMAYIQSDEASFVMTDYDQLDTQGWFGYKQSKIESVSAANMTEAFNYHMCDRLRPVRAKFDARAFNLPRDEVVNYFLWRAQDWHRNSVSMLAQTYFSQGELQGKNIRNLHDMLHIKGVNWATDVGPISRNGLFIYLNEMGEIKTSTNIQPFYTDINGLWEQAQPKEIS